MGTYRKEWGCCGSVTETDAWEPEACPFCTASPSPASDAALKDAVQFGTGLYRQNPDGSAEHIPVQQIYLDPASEEGELPPLPESTILGTSRYGSIFRGYTADQMRAYGQECARAASTRTASDTRTAAGSSECDAALHAAPAGQHSALVAALLEAECALADIGDADRDPRDDVAWCEARAAKALPRVRAALAPFGMSKTAGPACQGGNTQAGCKNCDGIGECPMCDNRPAEVDVEAERPRYTYGPGKSWVVLNNPMSPRDFAARTQADAGKDKDLLDYLDQWVANNKSEGYTWFNFAFGPNDTARTQIKADMDLAATKPEKP